ncbi:unnamed protein product [Vicia faba]|uniref:Katanin p80 subunit C-terminal domain-containing protein n=1 Tax=Vicia faba TaxID=3906 RepID=A0AAV1A6Q5_VICFA|nr:unnamed protein product [Vicia faba]
MLTGLMDNHWKACTDWVNPNGKPNLQFSISYIVLFLYTTNKLVVFGRWERNDVTEVINTMAKMADHAVIADIVSIIMEKIDMVTLDLCTSLLPLLSDLLQSKMDRHLSISVEMLLNLVRVFGSVIYSTLSAKPSVGVDIEAENRLERCNLCFIELEKVKRFLPSLMRRGGSIAKSAHELNLVLQDVS